MQFPDRPAYLSTNYNNEKQQHEVVIENVTPTTRFKICDNNELTVEKLENINFHLEDRDNRVTNSDTLDHLINVTTHESDELHSELLDNRESIPPFKFVIKSETLDITDLHFQISWRVG